MVNSTEFCCILVTMIWLASCDPWLLVDSEFEKINSSFFCPVRGNCCRLPAAACRETGMLLDEADFCKQANNRVCIAKIQWDYEASRCQAFVLRRVANPVAVEWLVLTIYVREVTCLKFKTCLLPWILYFVTLLTSNRQILWCFLIIGEVIISMYVCTSVQQNAAQNR